MKINIKLNTNEKILSKRKLQKGGEAQIHLTKQCAKWMNNYVPYKTGNLKDINVEIGAGFVKYNTPYAKKQYYTNKGLGKRNRAGLRGKFWDKKMWNDKGESIVKDLANFVGGRV